MDKKIMIKSFIILFVVSIAEPLFIMRTGWAACCTKNLETAKADPNCVETTLDKLSQKTKEIQSYQAQLEYKFSQPLLESQSVRKGVLYYTKSDKESRLRINFQTLKQDDEKEQKYIEHYIFDGIWLTHIDYQIKATKRYQYAEPNEPMDAFDLAGKNLPIIGFTKIEDLKKQFDVQLILQTQSEPSPFIQLHLKVKPDSIYKDDYTSIDFWIDKELYLPAKMVAVSTEEDIYEIKFLKPMVNKNLDKKVFEFNIPKDFSVEINPLKKPERPGAEDSEPKSND